MITAYIALGGNIGDVRAAFESAMNMMNTAGVHVCRVSSVIQTPALVPEGELPGPDFLNAVIEVQTTLAPLDLLDLLLEIERQHGRVRSKRWAPRTLDLDILLYGDLEIDHPRLRVPHPHMHARAFVKQPLEELLTARR